MRKTPLKYRSRKGQAIDREYRKLKEEHLQRYPGCQFKIDTFTGELTHFDDPNGIECGRRFYTTVHHRMGRGKHTCDPKWFMSACLDHHNWAEWNKKKARELGYILYK